VKRARRSKGAPRGQSPEVRRLLADVRISGSARRRAPSRRRGRRWSGAGGAPATSPGRGTRGARPRDPRPAAP